MSLKPISFEQQVDFVRPAPADYVDQTGEVQTAGIDELRLNYTDGQFNGLLLDSLLEESAGLGEIANFSTEQGAFLIDADLEDALVLPGCGFTELLTGSGKLAFVYSDGVGKCYANKTLLFTVDPITVSAPTALVAGGFAKVRSWEYLRNEPESAVINETTGAFEVADAWDFDADYEKGIFKSRDASGALMVRQFSDDHTFSRPTVKNVFNAVGEMVSVPSDQVAVNHDIDSLRNSETELQARSGVMTFTTTETNDYQPGETVVLTDTVGGRSLTGEVVSADGTAVTIDVPFHGVLGYGSGSDWKVIRSMGVSLEYASTGMLPKSQALDTWLNAGSEVTVTSGEIAPDGTPTAFKLEGIDATNYRLTEILDQATVIGTTYTISFWCYGIADPSVPGYYRVYNPGSGNTEFFDDQVVVGEWRFVELTSEATYETTAFQFRMLAGESYKVWLPQMEEGPTATSRIYTDASPVTRAADNQTIEDLDTRAWWNMSEGALFLKFNKVFINGSSCFLSLNDGSNQNRVELRHSGGSLQLLITNGGGETEFISMFVLEPASPIGVTWNENELKIAHDGQIYTITNGLPSISRLSIANRFDNNSLYSLLCTIKTLKILTQSIEETELLELVS